MTISLEPSSEGTVTLGLKHRIEAFWALKSVQNVVIALILINAVLLGMETSPRIMASWGKLITTLDHAILTVFVVEIASLLFARGWRFFKDPWSVFDFVVVGIALIPASGPFAVLRSLRVLRVLRLISKIPSIRKVVGALLGALPGMASVFALVMILFYVNAVIATKLFGQDFPELFGNLGLTFFTLFQVMTLEAWAGGVARPVMEIYPYAWIFFILFILTATFTVLNLFVAVIVNSLNAIHGQEESSKGNDIQTMRNELELMRRDVSELRKHLLENRNHHV
ncbi:MAG: ion transporter [Proteobacteria bacterium]|jgi:voltage-gated sodium channel|nr:ion transporter [Pseudomonadota bacterium]MDA0876067.1 ion transporter [Pseudomonadota bacterium]